MAAVALMIGVQVEGAAQLRKALREAGTAAPREIAGANKAAALVVVRRAEPMIPVRSGKLRRSTRALGSQRSGRVRVGAGQVAYAAAIHWGRKSGNVGSPPGNHPGTNPIKGRPFLTDALSKSLPKVVDTYETAVSKIVAKLNGASK